MTKRLIGLAVATALLAACGTADGGGPFELAMEPEFVQGVIPGERCVLLAIISDIEGGGGPVAISAQAAGAEVTVEPATIESGQVAEILVVPGSADEEIPFEVAVHAVRGDEERQLVVSTSLVPWEDSIGGTAADILAVFMPWLAENRPDLGIGPETAFEGTLVAPLLLVVSHYAFFSEEWEVGLSWHIMVAPDDWAQIYLRARDEVAPSLAFQLSSWSTALGGGPWTIEEIAPPAEVTR